MGNKLIICTLLIISTLNSIGVGIIMPILPQLLRNIMDDHNIYLHYGMLLMVYALFQLFFAPILGALSDKFGKRKVLVVSLLGSTIDYAIMAFFPILWILYIGRIITGITGATGVVISSYMANLSQKNNRAKVFGLLGATFGTGLIIGPVISGVSAIYSIQMPFIIASVLSLIALIMTLVFIPLDYNKQTSDALSIKNILNPVYSLKDVFSYKLLIPLFIIFFVLQLVGQLPASLWTIYTQDRLLWDSREVGFSIAAFGLAHVLVQGVLTGKITSILGEKYTLLLGIILDAIGCFIMAIIFSSWQVIFVLLFMSFGSVGIPALQAIVTNHVSSQKQGQLQGVLVTLSSLTSIFGPVFFTLLYKISLPMWNGFVWIIAILLYFLTIPAFVMQNKKYYKTNNKFEL